MLYAVISDVHANLEALKAVLADIHKREIKKILFLGDAVGYGPDPDECIKLLKKIAHVSVAGNHDWAAIDYTPVDNFNENARKAILWTKDNISEESIEYLKSLKIVAKQKKENACLVHSTPRSTDAWNYMFTLNDIETNFHFFEEKICFVGHSHVPFIAERLPSGEIELCGEIKRMGSAEKYIVNAGSVGQPRDNDPRACYIEVDRNTMRIIRIEYNIEETQEKMSKAGLPRSLIERLSRGM